MPEGVKRALPLTASARRCILTAHERFTALDINDGVVVPLALPRLHPQVYIASSRGAICRPWSAVPSTDHISVVDSLEYGSLGASSVTGYSTHASG